MCSPVRRVWRAELTQGSFSTAHFIFETVFQGTCSSMFGLCWLSTEPTAPPGCHSPLGSSVHTTMLDFYMDSGSPNSNLPKYFTRQVIFPVRETPPSPKQNRTKCLHLTNSKAVLLQPTPSEGRNIRAETPPEVSASVWRKPDEVAP